jgi:sugar/nucleoside kinase (ribokinase family)
MPKIAIVGHVCIDHNRSENASYQGWGSSVLYMGQYLKRAYNLRPVAITNYGPDMLKYMPDIEVMPRRPSRSKTLVFENDTRNSRRIQHCHNINSADAPEITSEVIEIISEADIIVFAFLLANYSVDYVRELLSHAKADALKVLCPQGYFRHIDDNGLVAPRDFSEAVELLPSFDLVMYSEEDYPEAFELARQWKQMVDTKIIVTQGDKGASIVERDQTIHVPTTPIPREKIVDSVGCGDIFAATATYTYWQNRDDLEAAIREAHKAAGAKLLAVTV